MIKLLDTRFILLILFFFLIITPFQKSFAGDCIQEFVPKIQQIRNDYKLGKYAAGLSKQSELNGKKGIITYGATIVKVKNASMLKRYQQKAQIRAKQNYLGFIKKNPSTISGIVTLEHCTKDILGNSLIIIKVFTPL